MSNLRVAIVILVEIVVVRAELVSQPKWNQTGGPLGGEMSAIAVGPTGDIYASSQTGGIFKSTNAGTTWIQVSEAAFPFDVLEINSKGTIFGGSIWEGEGIFRSTDGGVLWEHVYYRAVWTPAYSIHCDSLDDVIYAAVVDSGIIRSTDDGKTWTVIGYYDGTRSVWRNRKGYLFSGSQYYGDIYRSLDGGQSWENVAYHAGGFIESFAEGSNGYLYASCYRTGVIRSTDDGTSWYYVVDGLTDFIMELYLKRGPGDLILLAAPYSGYGSASHGPIYYMDNNAEHWNNCGIQATWPYNLAVHPGGAILAATRDGIWRSDDSAKTWVKSSAGLIATEVKEDAGSPAGLLTAISNDTLFVGIQRAGIYRSTDKGQSWLRVSNDIYNGQGMPAWIYAHPDGRIFSGDTFFGIFVSTNGGLGWSNIPIISGNAASCSINDEGDVFIGTPGGVARLMHGDSIWTTKLLYDPMAPIITGPHGFVYGACNTVTQQYLSMDYGTSYTHLLTIPQPFQSISSLLISRSGALFASTRDRWDSGAGNVFKSVDTAKSWSNISPRISSTSYYTLVNDSMGGIMLGSTHGAFRSTDDGASWTPISTGLTKPKVTSLTVAPDGDVFAGTIGSGVWRLPASEILDVRATRKIPTTYSLEQNFPNPFNPSTTIRYSLPAQSFVRLEVFDLLGRTIAKVVDTKEEPGSYSVPVNLGKFASGMYIYKLTTERQVSMKKMILAK